MLAIQCFKGLYFVALVRPPLWSDSAFPTFYFFVLLRYQLFEVLFRDYRLATLLLNILARAPRHCTAVFRILLERHHTKRIAVAVQLGGGRLGQHSQDQLNIGHMVAQVFTRQRLHLFVLVHFQGKGTVHDFVGQNGEFLAIRNTALLPLVGQI